MLLQKDLSASIKDREDWKAAAEDRSTSVKDREDRSAAAKDREDQSVAAKDQSTTKDQKIEVLLQRIRRSKYYYKGSEDRSATMKD